MTDEFDRDPVADALRDSLAAHARQAPRGELLAEQIIYRAEQPADPRHEPRRGWRTWTLPLIAAGAVAGVVGAVVGIQSYHPNASGPQPGHQNQSSITVQRSVAPNALSSHHAPPPDLMNVRIVDLTFTGDNAGWALATATCTLGSGRCSALLHTSDGKKWFSAPHTPFNVQGVSAGCAYRCVTNIRFVNSRTGYLYGPSTLLMTTDGGNSWQQQPGGAIQLESLNGNVIRVTSTGTGCPLWCNVSVETSAIGSSKWTPANLPSSANLGYGVRLVRSNSGDAYLLFPGHVAGGAQNATSHLYRSTDNGLTWTSAGEPCPQTRGEVDSHAIAAGNGETVTVLCATRQAPQRWFVATSSNAAASFAPKSGRVPAATADLLTGDPATVLVTGGNGLAVSMNGGHSWQRIANVTGQVSFLGFESSQVGRAVTDQQRIWTTRDGGKTWSLATFA